MIQVFSDCDPNQIGPKQNRIKNIVVTVFSSYKINNAEISIIFGNDHLLRKIKKEFFKVDYFTDVIAFRLNKYEEKNIEGEIYISLPRARENAEIYKEPYEKEISRLIIHACLHLIGFSDETELEKNKMRELENNFLGEVSWENFLKK